MTARMADASVGSAVSQTEPVLVVGAGPGGLAVAAELGRLGVRAEILERGDAIALAWRQRYDRLRLNTSRRTSMLSGERYPRGTPAFPTRDEVVRYLDSYAERHELRVQFGVQVNRIDANDAGWLLSTSAGEWTARQVVVTTGCFHTPKLPDWPEREMYPGRLLHSSDYRSADEFRGADVLVVGLGCSGIDIAYDLAQGGAERVRVAVRTQPQLLLRTCGGVSGLIITAALLRLPGRLGDPVGRFVRRMTIGDLGRWGLTPPERGIVTDVRDANRWPVIVDMPVINAVKTSRIEIVAGATSADRDGVHLADGTRLRPDVIILATGYSSGLDKLAGHLGVVEAGGAPRVHGGAAVLPGLRFVGYQPSIGTMTHAARRAARGISRELAAATP